MKPSVERVLDLMQATFGSEFKTYYNGDPEVIPSFNLPAIIVTQLTDRTTESAQGEDDVTDRIRIKVLLDQRDDYTGSNIDPLNLTEKRIRDYVGQVQADRHYPKKSIKGALRNALLDGVTAIAPNVEVNYGIFPRDTLGIEDNVQFTSEGHVTFDIQYSVDTY